MSWTTELAAAETAEQAYRAAAKGSQPSFYRFDGRAMVLLGNWIGARAAASTVKVPASNASFWANVAMRAVTNMGASWTVVQTQLSAPPGPLGIEGEMYTHQPFGFPGNLDGLFDGLISPWSSNVWTSSGRTLPTYAFPSQETWSYLFANSITLAGPT